MSVTIRGVTTDVSKWGVTIEVVTPQGATIQNIANRVSKFIVSQYRLSQYIFHNIVLQ